MAERKEHKYTVYGSCPDCGKLVKLELVVTTELVQKEKPEKVQEGKDGKGQTPEGKPSAVAEGSDLRPGDPAGQPDELVEGSGKANRGKKKRAKKAGSEQ